MKKFIIACVAIAALSTGYSKTVPADERTHHTDENAGITLLVKKPLTGLLGAVTSTRPEITGNANSALFRLPFVKEELRKLYNFIYNDKIPAFILNNEKSIPQCYRLVAANIYGNIAAIPVPEDMLRDDFIIADENGKTTCKCNDTNPTGCEKDSFFSAVFCEAKGCKSCSLID